ncbi:MAG: TRZ/ATZ family hydrolase, partial [Proteobacteria bacterium SW_6_67_9]
MSEQPDALLAPRWLVTVDDNDRVLTDHVVAIADGRILAIEDRDSATRRWPDVAVTEYRDHALMPGLINAHTHAAMNLFRGLADDLPLGEWLQQHIWPAEGQWVDEAFVGDGTELALAEMVAGGITCFNDMYFFPEVTARVAAERGVRAVIGMILLDFPTQYADGPDQYLDKGLALHDRYRDHPLVQTAFAPHAPYTVSDAPLERVRTYADELERPVHIHVHETAAECGDAQDQHGERPLARLERLGLLSPALA